MLRVRGAMVLCSNIIAAHTITRIQVVGMVLLHSAIFMMLLILMIKEEVAKQQLTILVIIRLADILLMKAEAILRGGTATAGPGGYGATAAAIVNNIRIHPSRGLTALATVDLNAIYKERGFELYWEGWRRNDMIRFGTFLNARQLKGVTTSERLLFPIPNQQLSINPNLVQNPGY